MQVLSPSSVHPVLFKKQPQKDVSPRFTGSTSPYKPEKLHDSQLDTLANQILNNLDQKTEKQVSKQEILDSINHNKPIRLPVGYQVEYGVLHPGGTVDSPYPSVKALLDRVAKRCTISKPTPVILQVTSPTIDKAFEHTIKQTLRSTEKGLAHLYKSPSGVENHNVFLTPLIEHLVSGATQALPDKVKENILPVLLGYDNADNPLRGKYKILLPGDGNLTQFINQSPEFQKARTKYIGLDLAKKIYSESQSVEKGSVILSLIVGGLGEPTINHFFHDGGVAASIARTTILSGVDILGNILSVMGMVTDRLQARDLKLSLKTVFNKDRPIDVLKNPGMDGVAGPDIKHGIKIGLQGGVLGVLTNIPAATVLSFKDADVLPRAIIGGIGAASSGVAIPFEVQDAKKSMAASIEALSKRGMLQLPTHLKTDKEKSDYIDRLIFKEMNSRIGYASSIKAMNPIALAGSGMAILGAEQLGIPREYVQTAYMSLAPVMHNFLRLIYAGNEKYRVIPSRIKTLETLVNESKDQPFTPDQLKKMDRAFLSGFDSGLDQWLTSTVPLLASSAVIFGSEFLYFAEEWKKNKHSKGIHRQPMQNAPTHKSRAYPAPPSMRTMTTAGPTTFMPLKASSVFVPLQSNPWQGNAYLAPFYPPMGTFAAGSNLTAYRAGFFPIPMQGSIAPLTSYPGNRVHPYNFVK